MKTCIVHQCGNRSADGNFVGDLCAPCHRYLTTGKIGPTRSFLAELPALAATLQTIHANAAESAEWIRRHTTTALTRAGYEIQ